MKIESVVSEILQILPDKNAGTHRLLFCSLNKVAKDEPKVVVRYILDELDKFSVVQHDVIFDLFAKLIQDDENCVSNGQAEEMIPLATAALSQSRLNLIGSLCGKYASEIVDHLLSQSCDHTMAYLSRVAEECDLAVDLIFRLLTGSQSYIVNSEEIPDRVNCCRFISKIMQNMMEKKGEENLIDQAVFDNLLACLLQWHGLKNNDSLLRDKSLEAATLLCFSMPWGRADCLTTLKTLYSPYLKDRKSEINIIYSYHLLLSLFINKSPRLISENIEQTMADLFRIVNPTALQQSDVYRCWGCLVQEFPTLILQFLLKKLDNMPSMAIVKVKALRVIQYLINYEKPYIQNRTEDIIKALIPIQSNTNSHCRLHLLHVTQALLNNQMLDSKNASSGRQLVEFIVRMAALRKNHPDPDLKKLRIAAENIFQLSSSSSNETRAFLWPLLLTFLTMPAYHGAASSIAKALEMIANRQVAESLPLEFPSKPAHAVLFVRCLLFLSNPKETEPGALLSFLQYLSKSINAEVDAIFRVVLPRLDAYLSANLYNSSWNVDEWHQLLLKLVTRSLSIHDSGSFLSGVRSEISKTLVCPQSVRSRPFLLQCSAAALSATPNTKFILNGIDELMNISIHQNPFERDACAKAIRLLANSKHFDSVVDRFLKSSQGKVMKTETKITKIIFGSGDTQREHVKSTVFSALTHIFNTMIEKETYSVFIQCTQFLLEAGECSSLETWLEFWQAVSACSKVSAASGKTFLGRNTVIDICCKRILPKEEFSSIHPEVIASLSNLILSQPAVQAAEAIDLLRFSLSVPKSSEFPSCYLEALTSHFDSTLKLSPSADNCFNLLMLVKSWLLDERIKARQSAIHIWLSILVKFLDYVNAPVDEHSTSVKPGDMHHFQSLLPVACIRCLDSDLVTRRTALEVVIILIDLYYARSNDTTPTELREKMTRAKRKILTTETESMFAGAKELGQIYCELIRGKSESFISGLLDSISDPDEQAANGAVLFLTLLAEEYPIQDVKPLMRTLIGKLRSLPNSHVKSRAGILSIFAIIGAQSPDDVVDELIHGDTTFCDVNSLHTHIWRYLAPKPFIGEQFWKILREKLCFGEIFNDSTTLYNGRRPSKIKIVELDFLGALCASLEVIPRLSAEVIKDDLSQHLSRLIGRWAMLIDASFPLTQFGSSKAATTTPSIIMADLLKVIFQKIHLLSASKKARELPNTNTEDRITTQLVCKGLKSVINAIAADDMKFLCELTQEQMKLLDASSSWEADLATISILSDTMVILSQSLKSSNDQNEANTLLSIMKKLSTICECSTTMTTVRFIAINGLGNLFLPPEIRCLVDVDDVFKSLLELFLSILRGSQEDMILSEAFHGITKVVRNSVKPPMSSFRKPIFQMATTFFQKANPATRRSAVEVITVLSVNFRDDEDKEDFVEELHRNLLDVLICLADNDKDVKHAAQDVLLSIAPLMVDECEQLIQKHAKSDNLHTGEFTAEFCCRYVKNYSVEQSIAMISTAKDRLSSPCGTVRGQATTIVGALTKDFPESPKLAPLAAELLPIFVQMLHDECPDARARAGEALSFIYRF